MKAHCPILSIFYRLGAPGRALRTPAHTALAPARRTLKPKEEQPRLRLGQAGQRLSRPCEDPVVQSPARLCEDRRAEPWPPEHLGPCQVAAESPTAALQQPTQTRGLLPLGHLQRGVRWPRLRPPNETTGGVSQSARSPLLTPARPQDLFLPEQPRDFRIAGVRDEMCFSRSARRRRTPAPPVPASVALPTETEDTLSFPASSCLWGCRTGKTWPETSL